MKLLLTKKAFIATFGLLFIYSLSPLGVQAVDVQTSYTPLAPLPIISSTSAITLATTVDFQSYVTYAFNLLIAIAAVMAVFMITFGGFQYMTSDAIQGKKDGLEKIKNAIYGLILVLSSYLILKTIDPRFVNIPSSLVTPLALNQRGNLLSDWQNTMNQISAEYQSQSLSATAAHNAAVEAANIAQQKFAAAQSAVTTACATGDPIACAQAQADFSTAQDQLNTANSNVAVTKTVANMTGMLSAINSGGTALEGTTKNTQTFQQSTKELLDQEAAANTKLANAAIATVNANGGDPTAIQTIQQASTITARGILVAQIQLSPDASSVASLQGIIKSSNSVIAQSTNPDIKAAAATVVQNATAVLNQINTKTTFSNTVQQTQNENTVSNTYLNAGSNGSVH